MPILPSWGRMTSATVSSSELPTAYGLAVFALPPGGRRPEPGWRQRCTRDPDRVQRWLAAGCNVGVGCRASGVVGLDLDRHEDGPDGVATFAALCAAWGQPWPDTLTVTTPHGLHVYLRVPDGCTVLSTSRGRSGLGAGIDTRGPGRRSGGYLVGPGSVVGGQRYTITRACPIATLPPWLAHLLCADS